MKDVKVSRAFIYMCYFSNSSCVDIQMRRGERQQRMTEHLDSQKNDVRALQKNVLVACLTVTILFAKAEHSLFSAYPSPSFPDIISVGILISLTWDSLH